MRYLESVIYIFFEMIKNHYRLSQESCCGPPGNFTIHEVTAAFHEQQAPKTNEQVASTFSEMNLTPMQNVGKFQELKASKLCWCLSFKPIVQLNLHLYGQRLSSATTQNSCCFSICNGQLIVLAINNVIIGKIKKSCNSYISPYVLTIQNQQEKQIFTIRMECCQCANIFPRLLKCQSILVYSIYNDKDECVGKISNIHRGFINTLCSLRDDFQIQFIKVEKQKEKILLLNAVVFLNQLRHELF